jgi:predicted  nucleic acid-binding Zn-ribbon protein
MEHQLIEEMRQEIDLLSREYETDTGSLRAEIKALRTQLAQQKAASFLARAAAGIDGGAGDFAVSASGSRAPSAAGNPNATDGGPFLLPEAGGADHTPKDSRHRPSAAIGSNKPPLAVSPAHHHNASAGESNLATPTHLAGRSGPGRGPWSPRGAEVAAAAAASPVVFHLPPEDCISIDIALAEAVDSELFTRLQLVHAESIARCSLLEAMALAEDATELLRRALLELEFVQSQSQHHNSAAVAPGAADRGPRHAFLMSDTNASGGGFSSVLAGVSARNDLVADGDMTTGEGSPTTLAAAMGCRRGSGGATFSRADSATQHQHLPAAAATTANIATSPLRSVLRAHAEAEATRRAEEIADLTARLADRERETQLLRSMLEAEVRNGERRRVQQLEENQRAANEEMALLGEERDDLRTRVAHLEIELREALAQIVQKEIAANGGKRPLRTADDELVSDPDALQAELTRLRDEVATSLHNETAAVAEIDALSARLAEEQRACATARAAVNALEKAGSVAQHHVAELEGDVARYRSQAATAERERAEAVARADKLKSDLTAMRGPWEGMRAALRESHQALADVKQDFLAQVEALEEQVQTLQAEKAAALQQTEALQARLSALPAAFGGGAESLGGTAVFGGSIAGAGGARRGSATSLAVAAVAAGAPIFPASSQPQQQQTVALFSASASSSGGLPPQPRRYQREGSTTSATSASAAPPLAAAPTLTGGGARGRTSVNGSHALQQLAADLDAEVNAVMLHGNPASNGVQQQRQQLQQAALPRALDAVLERFASNTSAGSYRH